MKMLEFLIQIDKQLFLLINGCHSPLWDQVMWFFSAKQVWYPFYAMIVILLALRYRWHVVPLVVSIALLIVISDWTSVHLFKEVFLRLRPCHEPDLQGLVHLVNNKCGGQYGFVSSHAANSFAAATLIFLLFHRIRWFALMFLWAAVVSYSRVYLGVHYPADILGGAMLGVLSGLFVWRMIRLYNNRLANHQIDLG